MIYVMDHFNSMEKYAILAAVYYISCISTLYAFHNDPQSREIIARQLQFAVVGEILEKGPALWSEFFPFDAAFGEI